MNGLCKRRYSFQVRKSIITVRDNQRGALGFTHDAVEYFNKAVESLSFLSGTVGLN